eukprot:SAG31_NODE_29253_length_398_cov_0.986622_1_plen_91_part_01
MRRKTMRSELNRQWCLCRLDRRLCRRDSRRQVLMLSLPLFQQRRRGALGRRLCRRDSRRQVLMLSLPLFQQRRRGALGRRLCRSLSLSLSL